MSAREKVIKARLTCVIAEGVQDSDEVVQAGPVVRIAPQPFLKSMASQGDPDEPQGHMSDFIPEVDIRGVQHDCLEAAQRVHTLSRLSH